MMADGKHEVQCALKLLEEEVRKYLAAVREQGAEAFRRGDDKNIERLRGLVGQLERFAAQVEALRKQWNNLHRTPQRRRAKKAGESAGRPRDIIHEREYILPILQALHDAGGSAPVSAVRDAVERRLRPLLGTADYALLKSGDVRWVNRMQWVRLHMVNAGMLSADSPRGVWQITPRGEEVLASGDAEQAWREVSRSKQGGGA